MSHHETFVSSWSAALVLTPAVADCSGGDQSRAVGDRLRVVATTTQVGSIAAEVGADAIELTVLLHPGVEAHDFEMTPADARRSRMPRSILRSGAGLEAGSTMRWRRSAPMPSSST